MVKARSEIQAQTQELQGQLEESQMNLVMLKGQARPDLLTPEEQKLFQEKTLALNNEQAIQGNI